MGLVCFPPSYSLSPDNELPFELTRDHSLNTGVSPSAEILQDVQHLDHLAEDEDPVSLLLQLGQQLGAAGSFKDQTCHLGLVSRVF